MIHTKEITIGMLEDKEKLVKCLNDNFKALERRDINILERINEVEKDVKEIKNNVVAINQKTNNLETKMDTLLDKFENMNSLLIEIKTTQKK